MDVRCPRCHVEYEFDDAKVTAGGVAVQCTSCGHVFRVGQPVPDAATPPPSGSEEWMVRQADGRVIRFKELTTLQKWIVEQKVERTDQISRTGKSWRPLGEIAELSSFFAVVDAARAAQAMAQQGLVPVAPMAAMPLPASTMPSPQAMVPPLSPAQHTLPHQTFPAPLTVSPPSTPPHTVTPARPTPAIHTASTETFFNPGADDGPSLDALDEDDPVKQWQRRSTIRRGLVMALVLVIGGGAGVYALRPDLVDVIRAELGAARGLDPALVARADQALVADLEGELDAVSRALEHARGEGSDDVTAAAWHARALVARARQSAEVARLSTLPRESAERRAQSEALLAEAHTVALAALAKDAQAPLARLANADVQAAAGAVLEMESDLEAALDREPSPVVAREAAVIRALGHARRALDASGEEQALARRRFDEALTRARALSPDDHRLVYASLAVRTANVDDAAARDEAKRELAESAAKLPAHTALGALARAHAPVVEAAPADAGPAVVDDAMRNPPPPAEQEPPPPPDDGKKPAKSVDFDTALARADRLRISDKARQALALYKKAAELRPDDPRPHAGIGWASLDAEQTTSAIIAFKKALSLSPSMADAHLGLAEAYRARGQASQAIESYQAYLRIAPSGEEAPAARRALEILQKK